MTELPKRPLRKQTKPPTREEQEASTERAKIGRAGRLAFEKGEAETGCPFPEGHPSRQPWLEGRRKGNAHQPRHDMLPATSRGYWAARDGLDSHECPFPRDTEENPLWHEGHERGEKSNERERNNSLYR